MERYNFFFDLFIRVENVFINSKINLVKTNGLLIRKEESNFNE